MSLNATLLKFAERDVEAANKYWGCNCGPAALAACMGLTLGEVRPHLGLFEQRRYMSPTMMQEAIQSAGGTIQLKVRGNSPVFLLGDFPAHGLVRIQWTGPWSKQGSNTRWAYGYTHWIHSRRGDGRLLIFDVNSGFSTYDQWAKDVVPALTNSIKRADGGFYPTHYWSVEINEDGI